ncbi:MAG: hypothetical protein K2Y56_07615 [Methylobacterium sp.]|uniref:hypothetical protein n=1 Tax=Methylobacterium sp. TaxID=409 RepID=UPI0025CF1B0E|nr:hypothetical protein [Methylobacterium sp.]MBX9931391.1 hypothetical protein [Methylobacterium sp.]
MGPHKIERDGKTFTIGFERTPEGWLCRIRREDDDATQLLALADGAGYDPADERGSLIAACEAAIAVTAWPVLARH